MAQDIVKSLSEESVAGKLCIAMILCAFIAHLFPWVGITGSFVATTMGFQTTYGVVSGVLLALALLLVLLTLAVNLSAIGRKNARVFVLVCTLIALICQIVLYFHLSEEIFNVGGNAPGLSLSAELLKPLLALNVVPRGGLYAAVVFSIGAFAFSLLSLRGKGRSYSER